MAGNLQQRTKETTNKHINLLQVADRTHEGAEHRFVEQKSKKRSDHPSVVRTRLLNNPTVLDTLDSVHRSLLFNNLKFEPDEKHRVDELSSSSASFPPTIIDEHSSGAEEPLESAATRNDLTFARKVNIAAPSARSAAAFNEFCRTSGHADGSNDVTVKDLRYWNNNINGCSCSRSTVKKMVQQYQKTKERGHDAVAPSMTLATGADAPSLASEPFHHVASVDDVETSDFESASVTSGSSLADGGCRSVRTSSAFSEGSRDVASIDRFDLVTPETQEGASSQVLRQEVDLGGHSTNITININYRCDTNSLRPRHARAKNMEDDKTEKTVDIAETVPVRTINMQACAAEDDPQSSSSNSKSTTVEIEQSKNTAVQALSKIAVDELVDLEVRPEQSLAAEYEIDYHEKQIENKRHSSSNQKKTEHNAKHRRSSVVRNRSCQTPENEEFYDCSPLNDSTFSFYEQANSKPVTPQDSEKKRRSQGQNSSTASSADNNVAVAEVVEQPMIRIVQELIEDQGEITSTITVNKAQIEQMQKHNDAEGANVFYKGEKSEKRNKVRGNSSKKRHDKSNLHRQQRIIDDNFCNEILDSTIHFDRLYGINRNQDTNLKKSSSSPTATHVPAEECFSDSVVCDIASPGNESFDSGMSVGKLEGKPRYSGKTMGRLMMKRLKKLQQSSKAGRMITGDNTDTSEASVSSSMMLQTSGPKKPPRTFANSPKRSATLTGAQAVPSCPARDDLDDSEPSDNGIGWKLNPKPNSHQVGWAVPAAVVAKGRNPSIPAQVYNMLHYSEDESRDRLIQRGNAKPAPQQSAVMRNKLSQHHWEGARIREPLGPKLDIDMVDGPITPPPRRHSSSTDFERFVKESNVKSTPHRKGEQKRSRAAGATSEGTRRLIEQFLEDERQQCSAHRNLSALPAGQRRHRTTGGIFERRRQQQENFLDDARRTNHEPRRRRARAATGTTKEPSPNSGDGFQKTNRKADSLTCSTSMHNNASVGGKVTKRRTFRKAALLKHTRTLFEASKRKIWALRKIETPEKVNNVSSNTTPSKPHAHDPNINRNSSVKKKQNLHHKHLGFTPDHLRCKSCQSGPRQPMTEDSDEKEEELIVPINHHLTQHAVPQDASHRVSFPGKENKENNCSRGRNGTTNRKSVRSLNFTSATRQQPSPAECLEGGENMSPRKSGRQLLNETKFMKTLRNIKISPKRMFRFVSQSSTAGTERCPMADREGHGQGEFHSFDDLNLDNVAHMGDFLYNIRRVVDGGEPERRQDEGHGIEGNALRQVDVRGEQEDEDPIYQEISPKEAKTTLNVFISSETNKRYLMVNNNPNILYATVSKTRAAGERSGSLARARSLTNVASAGVADPGYTSTPVSKPQNNTSKSQMKSSYPRGATLSPDEGDGPCRDLRQGRQNAEEEVDEPESRLYATALAESSSCYCHAQDNPERLRGGDYVGGRCQDGRSPNNGTVTSVNSTRRSLFSHGSSRKAWTAQTQRSTDESDISVLQDAESVDISVSERAGRKGQEATTLVAEPLIVRERVEDRLAAGFVVRRGHEQFQQQPTPASGGNRNGKGQGYHHQPAQVAQDEEVDRFSFEKDIIVDVTKDIRGNVKDIIGRDIGHGNSGGRGRRNSSTNTDGLAPLGCFDTDSEIESLRRYEDKEIEDLIISLHDNVTVSDMGSLETATTTSSAADGIDEIGYDTVDLAPAVARAFHRPAQQPDHRNLSVDTVDVSALISHPEADNTFATSNVSPLKASPSSVGGKMLSSSGGVAVMRNLKDKLQSSFRKSKSFIKSERKRFTNYLLEEHQGSRVSSSVSSSSASSSPRKRAEEHAAVAMSEQDSDELYRSLAGGSSGIISTGSMTELSSQHMADLILQIKRQADARKQLKQALAICRSTREFECSTELIEAERLLLLASLKEAAARNELGQIDYSANGMTMAKRKRIGVVSLNHFEFPLTDMAVKDAMFNFFYVIVCTYKDQVYGTVAVERHHDGRVYFRDCGIRFEDLDADYEIRVEVFVMRLRKNTKNYSFESRYHLEKDSQKRSPGCPSPSKRLREAGRMLSFRSNSPKTFDFDNEFSRFESHGFLTFTSFALLTSRSGDPPEDEQTFEGTYATARDHTTTTLGAQDGEVSSTHVPYYSVSSNFQQMIRLQGNEHMFVAEDFMNVTLDSMSYNSNMTGPIGLSVNSEVRFDGSDVSGFLEMGEKHGDGGDGITWNRRWCKLNGFMLEFWNYPQECQEKQPIQCVNLLKCVNERIELAERSICSRPRTLKVDVFVSQNPGVGVSCNSSGFGSFKSTAATISPHSNGEVRSTVSDGERHRAVSPAQCSGKNVKYFLLAADNRNDLKRWLIELNRAVKFLKEWKI